MLMASALLCVCLIRVGSQAWRRCPGEASLPWHLQLEVEPTARLCLELLSPRATPLCTEGRRPDRAEPPQLPVIKRSQAGSRQVNSQARLHRKSLPGVWQGLLAVFWFL